MIAKTNGSKVLSGYSVNGFGPSKVLDESVRATPRPATEVIRIRPYRGSDREAICGLCCDTGFLGRPIDALFLDRDLFGDLFTKAYLDHEPESSLVAEADGRVVGYLLGSVRRHFDLVQVYCGFLTASRMVMRMAAGRYAGHRRSRRFIRWLFTAGFFEQPRHPRNAAHLHVDIERSYRGRGLGRRLWIAYERRLLSAGVAHCYGAFFSHPKRRPEYAYARYGFSVFDRRRTTLFEPEMGSAVEVVCVSKSLETAPATDPACGLETSRPSPMATASTRPALSLLPFGSDARRALRARVARSDL